MNDSYLLSESYFLGERKTSYNVMDYYRLCNKCYYYPTLTRKEITPKDDLLKQNKSVFLTFKITILSLNKVDIEHSIKNRSNRDDLIEKLWN